MTKILKGYLLEFRAQSVQVGIFKYHQNTPNLFQQMWTWFHTSKAPMQCSLSVHLQEH